MSIPRTAVSATLGVLAAVVTGGALGAVAPSPFLSAAALLVAILLGGAVGGYVARNTFIGVVVGIYFTRPGAAGPVERGLISAGIPTDAAGTLAVILIIATAVIGSRLGQRWPLPARIERATSES